MRQSDDGASAAIAHVARRIQRVKPLASHRSVQVDFMIRLPIVLGVWAPERDGRRPRRTGNRTPCRETGSSGRETGSHGLLFTSQVPAEIPICAHERYSWSGTRCTVPFYSGRSTLGSILLRNSESSAARASWSSELTLPSFSRQWTSPMSRGQKRGAVGAVSTR